MGHDPTAQIIVVVAVAGAPARWDAECTGQDGVVVWVVGGFYFVELHKFLVLNVRYDGVSFVPEDSYPLRTRLYPFVGGMTHALRVESHANRVECDIKRLPYGTPINLCAKSDTRNICLYTEMIPTQRVGSNSSIPHTLSTKLRNVAQANSTKSIPHACGRMMCRWMCMDWDPNQMAQLVEVDKGRTRAARVLVLIPSVAGLCLCWFVNEQKH